VTITCDRRDYDWFCAFLRAESAIVIDDSKEYLVTSRLAPILKELGLDCFGGLVALLRTDRKGVLHQKVVEAMTTNETSFFRDLHPFDALRSNVLPAAIAKNGTGTINIWCAASSTGQEPYTIAMVIREAFPDVASRTRILCTDINEVVLERTKQGRYSQLEVNRGLPASLLIKYFTREGANWQVKDELRRMIDARVMNLAVPWLGLPTMDVVFIRNVLIYFDMDAKRDIVARLRKSLCIGGSLFVGGSETLLGVDSGLARTVFGKTTVYQRTA
jgi:chemotaxis protein methyltransferase CheR